MGNSPVFFFRVSYLNYSSVSQPIFNTVADLRIPPRRSWSCARTRRPPAIRLYANAEPRKSHSENPRVEDQLSGLAYFLRHVNRRIFFLRNFRRCPAEENIGLSRRGTSFNPILSGIYYLFNFDNNRHERRLLIYQTTLTFTRNREELMFRVYS
jgi:hypothetical protein